MERQYKHAVFLAKSTIFGESAREPKKIIHIGCCHIVVCAVGGIWNSQLWSIFL